MNDKSIPKTLVDSDLLTNFSAIDFLNASPVAMFIFGSEFEILAYNSPFRSFYPDIHIGDQIGQLVQNESLHSIRNLLEEIEKNFGVYKVTFPYKSGYILECSIKSIKSKDNPVLFLASLSLDFKCDEVFLLQQLVYTLPENIYMKDSEGRFLMANQYLAKTMGVKDPSELIGRTDFDFFPKNYARKYFEDEQQIIKTGIPLIDEQEKVLSHGRIRWFSTTKLPLYNKNGMIEGIMGIGKDISLNIKEQRVLEKARKEAENADKLKSAFLANLSHEIRTPLNGILGFSQFLKQKNHPEEKQHKYLDIIHSNGKQLLLLINDIIDISMIESNQLRIKYKSFSLNNSLTQLKAAFEYQLKQSGSEIQILSSPGFQDGKDIVSTDDFRLSQILNNLIGNAIKFTHEGKIEFGYTLENKLLTFFVSDTGIGIDLDQQKEIFERFRQADESMTRNYGGTGLGLSICRGLVHLLGGNIWVKSKPGEGSTFYFTIPNNTI